MRASRSTSHHRRAQTLTPPGACIRSHEQEGVEVRISRSHPEDLYDLIGRRGPGLLAADGRGAGGCGRRCRYELAARCGLERDRRDRVDLLNSCGREPSVDELLVHGLEVMRSHLVKRHLTKLWLQIQLQRRPPRRDRRRRERGLLVAHHSSSQAETVQNSSSPAVPACSSSTSATRSRQRRSASRCVPRCVRDR